MTTPAALRVDRPTHVYERLRALIIRGRLAPGVRVVEQDIAARLAVSRTPAREAIHRLFQEGFLTATRTMRRTELVVAPLTRADMVDLYELMASLEGLAARGAVRLAAAERRALARDLREIEAAFEHARREPTADVDRPFELHNAFHARLAAACDRPRLLALLDAVRPQVERYEWVYAPLVGTDHRETFAEHAAIVRTVREGDADAIQAAVAANWLRGAARLEPVIERAGARGAW